jgi:UDP-glucose 4-epimerase
MPVGHVVVLGGTGFLGREIARAFLASGNSVTVVARHEPADRWNADLAALDVVRGDVGDTAMLAPLVDRADHVVYAVGTVLPAESNADPVADITSSLSPVLSLLEVLRHRTGTGLTYLSSGGTVYGNPREIPVGESSPCEPITSYGITKLTAEKYIAMYAKLYGVPARVLRVGNAYGPLQPSGRSQGIVGVVLASARSGKPVRVFGDGLTTRDYVHVEDVANATVALAEIPGGPGVVNVGCGAGHTVLDVIDALKQVVGREVPVEHVPDRGFDVRSVVLDVSLLSSLISWEPVPFTTGMERTWRELTRGTASFARVG